MFGDLWISFNRDNDNQNNKSNSAVVMFRIAMQGKSEKVQVFYKQIQNHLHSLAQNR